MFSKSQYQTASDIVQLANAIIWLRNNQLQQFHLTSSQSDALLYILRQPEDQEITAGSLIQDLHLSQSTVAGIIKRLEAKIVEGPYIHHCVGIHKDVVPVLYEACKYMGITPDLYDPIEEDVKAYLRGE